jgi:hypothetical protein
MYKENPFFIQKKVAALLFRDEKSKKEPPPLYTIYRSLSLAAAL